MGCFTKKLFVDVDRSLSFDDIFIKPAYSDVHIPEVDLSLKLTDKLTLRLPIFSAAMDTVTGYDMAKAMILAGGCGVLHKNVPVEENVEIIKKLAAEFGDTKPIAVAVGAADTKETIQQLVSAGANILSVDCAHAHTKNIGALVEMISTNFPNIFLIAGNVVTREGAEFLAERGAKAIKVGLGPGSICTTRKVTGVGRGQATSIADVADFCRDKGIIVMADGGMRSSDEVMKALVCGADCVMLGYMLAGCVECPGNPIVISGQEYKLYRGMGSLGAMKLGSSARYGKDKVESSKWVPEGVESYVPVKGEVKDTLKTIEWGLKSAFGYVGARNINEVKDKASVTRITHAVLNKSNPHSLLQKIVKDERDPE